MSTRAMICVDLSGNERCYELYYRHCDGYCTKCGEKIEWSGTGWGKNDSDQCAACFDRKNNALGPEQSGAGEPEVQTCNECGNSVAPGSGRFVNRIPDFNKPAYRKEMSKPFPEGDYVCAECDKPGC